MEKNKSLYQSLYLIYQLEVLELNSRPQLYKIFKETFFLKKRKEFWNFGKLCAVDTIVLKFLTKLDSTDCSMGFIEIRYLKWHDVKSSNSWFLMILNGFSEDFLLVKLILKKRIKEVKT